MTMRMQNKISVLGLFEKRFEGDDCLMELGRRCFERSGLGAEMHASTPEQLEALLRFRPAGETEVVLHLPRDLDLMDPADRQRILGFANRFAGRIYGMVLHDRQVMVDDREAYHHAAWDLDDHLERIDRCPMLFIEYAVGLEPGDFVSFFDEIRDLDRISACIDIGHVGIREARAAYAGKHGGADLCALKSHPHELPALLPEIEAATRHGCAAAFNLIETLGPVGKPVHFHLHDGHPLSTASPFGVSDHLSFLAEIPLPFEFRGHRSVPPMFGPAGLQQVVALAVQHMGRRPLSFTLEIHPTGERKPLSEDSGLFGHWTDKTNAEKMNHWFGLLAENCSLVLQAIERATGPASDEETAELGGA